MSERFPDILVILRRAGAVHVVTEPGLAVQVIDERIGASVAGVSDANVVSYPGAVADYLRGCSRWRGGSQSQTQPGGGVASVSDARGTHPDDDLTGAWLRHLPGRR